MAAASADVIRPSSGISSISMAAELIVAVVVEALDGRLLDRAVHPFDLADRTIKPWDQPPKESLINAFGCAELAA